MIYEHRRPKQRKSQTLNYNWNAERFPVLCKLIDEDAEQGYKEFIIRKGRFCFRLTAPYSEERRDKARQLAMESNASDRLK